jgi:ATP-dependent DNA helicase RecQ
MTRAKNNLTIHYDGYYLDNIIVQDMKKVVVDEVYPPPDEFAMQLTHRDVWLGYFELNQDLVCRLTSGDALAVNSQYCCNSRGTPVLKFSKQRKEIIDGIKQKNYVPKSAKIKFIVYWKGEEMEKEIRIILPELYFKRNA